MYIKMDKNGSMDLQFGKDFVSAVLLQTPLCCHGNADGNQYSLAFALSLATLPD